MRTIKALLCLLVTVFLFLLLDTRTGDIPPLGSFLDPYHGFWQNAELPGQESKETRIEGLNATVHVAFDDHSIPHIFAQNDHDLYFTQGYLTARDRLWQMDFQTRFAAGRLSEVVGEKALELDKYQRRMGMAYGAEKMLALLKKDPQTAAITQAYADGVNAYIRTLKPEDYPIEFKILAYKPEKWEMLNTCLLLKLMSATLISSSDEYYMSNALAKYGPDIINNLFPDFPFKSDPIIPAGTPWPFKPLSLPFPPNSESGILKSAIKTKPKEEGLGSNNWAVSGNNTISGYPLLANDPHLDLNLPAIWHQIQLKAPGVNVCGVSIPGAPGVIIGFNQKVAWGVTNVGADVLDWYNITFRDSSLREYRYNNHWRPVKKRVEVIRTREGKTVHDTVYYTHHGPVVYQNNSKPRFSKESNVPQGSALRWIAHDPSNEIKAFYLLNRAENYDDYRKAIALYAAPAQNFVFASIDNDIAITSAGYFPLKWKNQGKFVLDGSSPENDWHGRIPAEQNPTIKNPVRGFVSSANQTPTDRTYPYYINWEFPGYERGHRINERLSQLNKATVADFRQLQNDNYSILAENILPVLTDAIDSSELTPFEKRAFDIVKKWNKFFNASETGATIFDKWQKNLFARIWQDKFDDSKHPMRYPSRDRTVELLLHESSSKWFDDTRTSRKETRDDLIMEAFKQTIDSLKNALGPIGKKWEWANVKGSHVPHLVGITGFGSGILYAGGSKTSVNALSEKNGPSWRMVVAIGKDKPSAYGVFPGGQSGNPGSFYYDDMLNAWTEGKLETLLFLQAYTDKNLRIRAQWTLSN